MVSATWFRPSLVAVSRIRRSSGSTRWNSSRPSALVGLLVGVAVQLDGAVAEEVDQLFAFDGEQGGRIHPAATVVAFLGFVARFRGRQRTECPVFGDLLDPHDRGAVDLLGRGDLGDRGLLADQLQPDLVLLRGRKEPLRTTLPARRLRLVLRHVLILLCAVEDPPDVV